MSVKIFSISFYQLHLKLHSDQKSSCTTRLTSKIYIKLQFTAKFRGHFICACDIVQVSVYVSL